MSQEYYEMCIASAFFLYELSDMMFPAAKP